ncbi:MAG TPA: universal stress protein [Nitrososphaerales archaeon]|nr:universal stress protein [Nitrososphaerales archaeon]
MSDGTPFRKILVAADGSDVSMRAMSHAARMAKEEGAELYLVHVVPSPPFEYQGEVADYFDQARSSATRWMKSMENEAARRNLAVRTEIIVGASSVVDTIVGYAETISCDLIVTGTRGKTPSAHVPVGSVAIGLVQAAKCPVLVVR